MDQRLAVSVENRSYRGSLTAGWSGALLLVVAWLVTRGVLLAQTIDGAVPTDVSAYQRWASELSAGVPPALDSAYVYPPGAPVLFALTDALTSPESFYRMFTIVAALTDFVILLLVWQRVRVDADWRIVAPWAWVVMGFAAGPLMYQRYDIFAALFAVLALLAISRPVRAGLWAAVGLLVKLWPEIVLLGLSKRDIWKGLVVNAVAVTVGWLILHFLWGDSFGFVANVMNKGLSVEATAAFPFMLARALGTSHGVTGQFGSWEVIGPGVDFAATATTVVGVLLLVALFLLRIAGRLDHAAPGDVVLLGVLVFVATHKINSLQYGVWIAAVTAAALSFSGSRAWGPAVLLTFMLLVADQVIWDTFVPFISGNPLLLAYQGMRLAFLLAALVWLAWSVIGRSGRVKPMTNNGIPRISRTTTPKTAQ